jgi:hypothetical protein
VIGVSLKLDAVIGASALFVSLPAKAKPSRRSMSGALQTSIERSSRVF